MRWFLDHGADPNAERIGQYRHSMGETALSKSMWHASFSAIKVLFEYGGPDTTRSGNLLWYTMNRDAPYRLGSIRYLLEREAVNDLTKVMYHDRPEAARQMEWVLGRQTPLNIPARGGRLDIVKLLVARGAGRMIPDSKGRLAIDETRKRLDSQRELCITKELSTTYRLNRLGRLTCFQL